LVQKGLASGSPKAGPKTNSVIVGEEGMTKLLVGAPPYCHAAANMVSAAGG
jgi:hypothetical protein